MSSNRLPEIAVVNIHTKRVNEEEFIELVIALLGE